MKKNCNICGKKFKEFLSLGNHPCADTFLKSKKKAKNLKRYPLIVGFCSCSHLTSIYPVPKHDRYEKYVGNDKLGEAIRQYGRNNPKNSIILKNSGNGAMLYLKYGRK